jgi:hypothetical protein
MVRRDVVRARLKAAGALPATVRQLLQDVADGIRVFRTRDGIALTNEQILERARNIVAGLVGNYKISALDARAAKASARAVDQMDLLAKLEERAEARNRGGRA